MPNGALGVSEEGAYEPSGPPRPSNAQGADSDEREAFKKSSRAAEGGKEGSSEIRDRTLG
jgi:hypothetical protein